MTKNMSKADRYVRIVLAIILGALYVTETVTGTPGIVLLVLGAVFLATSVVRFCPIYAITGLNTCPAEER